MEQKHSCGTMVLFEPSLDVEVESCEVDLKGRQIIERPKIDDSSFVFVNVYLPNELKSQVQFFEALKSRIRKYPDENVIIGGDLNCCLTPTDKRGGRPTEQEKHLIDSNLDLCNSIKLHWLMFGGNFILMKDASPVIGHLASPVIGNSVKAPLLAGVKALAPSGKSLQHYSSMVL